MITFRTIGFMVIFLAAYFVMLEYAGQGITNLVIAVIFLIEAVIFSVDGKYFDKFLKFMNPSYYKAYSEKGEEFKKKKRKISVIMNYILAAIFSFNSAIHFKSPHMKFEKSLFNIKELIIYSLIIIALVILLNYLGIQITKKSKTASQDIIWSLLLGLGFSFLIITGIVFYFIFF